MADPIAVPPPEFLRNLVAAPDPGPAPLSETERSEAEQAARRIVAELREVLDLLPPEQRGASAMSRAFSVDRATCQRLVSAVGQDAGGAETLVRLPGVQGLRRLLAALREREGRAVALERLSAAEAAVDRFEQCLGRLGGSQRRLRARLEAGARGAEFLPEPRLGAADDPATRQALFALAGRITGRMSRVSVHTAIIRPVPGRPDRTEGVRVRALLGHVWSEPAMPLEIGGMADLSLEGDAPAFSALAEGEGAGVRSAALLEEFCSRPLPRVTTRTEGARVVYVLDAERPERDGLDVVAAYRSKADRHPATLRPAVGEVWAMQNFPSARLVFDAFLHREIARRCLPSLEVHLWTPGGPEHVRARWSTRLPGGPRLELMGAGLGSAHTNAYPAYPRLMERVFGRLGWAAEEFVGFRCEVKYPVWRAGYCMRFDFGGMDGEGG